MGYIKDGVYHKDDVSHEDSGVQQADTYKSWDHQQQRERHAWEILQPHTNGKPNPEFIKAYPQESKMYFTDEELKQSGV